ncbi:MazG-like family protein [Alicyclobacillus fodiniaquatilis]|uniref:MazG-like family protein n=1 Tax=Alicyclobacillus fodiniaquatilis TaxID=1661150 RepID=A0ABW4JK99_9BACL
MANIESQVDLTRKLQTVEHDKIELVQQVVEVLRSIQSGNQGELTVTLGSVVGLAYLLGVQMGIAPHQIDHEIINGYRMAKADGVSHADLEEVIEHLHNRI